MVFVLFAPVDAQAASSLSDEEVASFPSLEVHSVPSANRFRIYVNNALHEVTLHSIDVPFFSYDVFQFSQSYGYESHMWVKNLIGWSGHDCRIDLGEAGLSGGGFTARVYCPSRDGWYDISHRMLELGLAWPQQKCCVSDAVIARAEQARARRVGVWSEEEPLPPWVFRSRQGIVD